MSVPSSVCEAAACTCVYAITVDGECVVTEAADADGVSAPTTCMGLACIACAMVQSEVCVALVCGAGVRGGGLNMGALPA